MVTHVHGAHTTEESDGYAEAWYLPNANNIPGYVQHTTGTFFDYFNSKYNAGWGSGFATFTYPNDQPATTLWYHDHTLGMTRLNVYAGPAGYYLLRGGPHDMDLGYVSPGPGIDPFGEFTEIPIAIQDRSFNADGSLFYPDNRAFFEGLDPAQLQIPFIPDEACDGLPSDVSPIWNPEFFGNMMVVNGQTWPFLEVEQRRYRFRFLNGCNSRFLVLKMTTTPRTGLSAHGSGRAGRRHRRLLRVPHWHGDLPGERRSRRAVRWHRYGGPVRLGVHRSGHEVRREGEHKPRHDHTAEFAATARAAGSPGNRCDPRGVAQRGGVSQRAGLPGSEWKYRLGLRRRRSLWAHGSVAGYVRGWG
jgi:hypothetical protein